MSDSKAFKWNNKDIPEFEHFDPGYYKINSFDPMRRILKEHMEEINFLPAAMHAGCLLDNGIIEGGFDLQYGKDREKVCNISTPEMELLPLLILFRV